MAFGCIPFKKSRDKVVDKAAWSTAWLTSWVESKKKKVDKSTITDPIAAYHVNYFPTGRGRRRPQGATAKPLISHPLLAYRFDRLDIGQKKWPKEDQDQMLQ